MFEFAAVLMYVGKRAGQTGLLHAEQDDPDRTWQVRFELDQRARRFQDADDARGVIDGARRDVVAIVMGAQDDVLIAVAVCSAGPRGHLAHDIPRFLAFNATVKRQSQPKSTLALREPAQQGAVFAGDGGDRHAARSAKRARARRQMLPRAVMPSDKSQRTVARCQLGLHLSRDAVCNAIGVR